MFTTTPLKTLTSLFVPALLLACGAAAGDEEPQGTDEPTDNAGYDVTLLEQYKSALPEDEEVTAVVPGPDGTPNALTALGDAELAALAIKSARDINRPAKLIVRVLRAITDVPPTLYDSEKKEFVWGPWENEDGHGQVIATIRENPPDDDFKYSYALIRLVDSDLATAAAVIWGGATPDPDDDTRGAGVTLWDFEANLDFEKAHDPHFDADARRDEGRFAMVYGAGRGEEDNGDFAFNVAVFRDFVSKDGGLGAEPANLDYFFGHFTGDDGLTVDFLDWQLTANLCDAAADTCFEMAGDGQAETLNLHAAFVNRGVGRAEAVVSGGDLEQVVGVTECWDDAIDRTYMGVSDDGVMVVEQGTCQEPFAATLVELEIPTLADVDQAGLALMDCVASNGLAACELGDD
jgi:hypothetical protein